MALKNIHKILGLVALTALLASIALYSAKTTNPRLASGYTYLGQAQYGYHAVFEGGEHGLLYYYGTDKSKMDFISLVESKGYKYDTQLSTDNATDPQPGAVREAELNFTKGSEVLFFRYYYTSDAQGRYDVAHLTNTMKLKPITTQAVVEVVDATLPIIASKSLF